MTGTNTPIDGDLQWLYVTTANDLEAQSIARALVGERLAACANVLGAIQSFYWWDGKMQEDAEVALVLKTQRHLVAQATARIKALHSYDCPCVVALEITGGNPDFLNWVVKETA